MNFGEQQSLLEAPTRSERFRPGWGFSPAPAASCDAGLLKPLRPLQEQAIARLRASLASGKRRVMLKSPTGSGKTVIASHIVQSALAKGKRVIFCVNAISLVDQTVGKFLSEGIQAVGVMQGLHEMTDRRQPVQVCSVQTLMRRTVPPADLVLIDEAHCFPAGTQVDTPDGPRRIEEVRAGDIVINAFGPGMVQATSINEIQTLFIVRLSNGTEIRCTGNHPFFTRRGWVPAEELESGDFAFGQEDVPRLCNRVRSMAEVGREEGAGSCGRPEAMGQARDLLEKLLQEADEPNALRNLQGQDGMHPEADQAYATTARRERHGANLAAGEPCEGLGRGVGNGVRGTDGRAPAELQNRHRESGSEDCDRGGRQEPCSDRPEGGGRAEGFLPGSLRVESVSRIELASPEPVFNLEVGGHPSFFANGVLVHNCWFKFYGEWMASWPEVPFIGLSATPYTKGLGRYYDDLVIACTTQDLIDAAWLSPFRVFAPSHPDLKGVKIVAGDYHEGQLAKVMDKNALTADVVETWLKLGEGRSTLCYGVNRAHARHMQEEFLRVGVPCGYMDANTEIEDRRTIAEQFKTGEIKVVANVGVLTTGIDWDVRCISLVRPTRSDMLFQQIIGRGLRIADGKKDCIAEGELVLTDHGLVAIERVTPAMRVWDGFEFVRHGGAVCRGEQEVINYAGLRATPDHQVWTEEGWRALGEAAARGLGIAATGVGGDAIRLGECDFTRDSNPEGAEQERGAIRVDAVRNMRRRGLDQLREPFRGQDEGVSPLQPTAPHSEMAHTQVGERQTAVHEFGRQALCGLRRAWDRISVRVRPCCGVVDSGESGTGAWEADRPNQQQRPLRTRESALGDAAGEYGQSTAEKAKVYVYDLLNAGPRHSFTVSGLLVHNCLVLDHSDTHLKLGFVTDIDEKYLELDDGKPKKSSAKKKEEPLPKECPSCHYLKPPRVSVCPACGFKPTRQSDVEHVDGELEELGVDKKTRKKSELTTEQKARFFGELQHYARNKGYKSGWAANKFRERIGVWPNAHRNAPEVEPSMETISWIRHSQIKWAKRKAA